MADETGPWPARLLDGELDAWVLALLTVVEQGHGPGDPGPLGVALGVVVSAVVGQLLHGGS